MKKLSLPEVTLVSVSSVDLDNTQLALLISSQRIEFGAVKLLSSGLPSRLVNGIEYVGVPPMTLVGYNRFVLGQLHQYVDTPHCLIVQADGFVLDSTRWTPEFLEYDYTGAPWPARVPVYPASGHATAIGFLDLARNRVGNGGFSLRSRKLLQATARIEYDRLSFPVMSEDIVVCHFLYDEMRAQGVRFAPFEVAARFSFESPSGHAERSVFGFHGKWMRDILLGDAAFRADVAAVKAASERSAGATAEAGRNDPCPCGSGKRYKHCHGMLG